MKRLQKPSAPSRPREAGGHTPVLVAEVVAALARPDASLVDATVGDGGHAAALLAASEPGGRLLGIDLDADALGRAARVLEPFGDRVRLVHGTFADIERLTEEHGFGPPTGVLLDLGLRTGQLGAGRGFSFHGDAPLDMRFDASGQVPLPTPQHQGLRALARRRPAYTAADVLAALSAADLAAVLAEYGDERAARRIADAIVRTRRHSALRSASALAAVVVQALPRAARHGRIHAATKTFQALRIAVNRERESLEAGLAGALRALAPGGTLAVIAYHSGEDRVVKHVFRAAAQGTYALVTKKPQTPTAVERAENPRSRSAKLRTIIRQHPTPVTTQ